MEKLRIFCVTNKEIKHLEKLNLTLAGVGKKRFKKEYVTCLDGRNIQNKEKHYSELTFHYWFWKNQLKKFNSNTWIGFCQKRRFWLKSDVKIKNLNDMIAAANILLKFGVKNILLKGGHSKTKLINDIFLNKKEIKIFKNKRIKTKNTHGTGCTLSSAITTFYACGKTLNKSCELAIKYVNQSVRSNPNYGKGHGPINHLSSIKINRKFK